MGISLPCVSHSHLSASYLFRAVSDRDMLMSIVVIIPHTFRSQGSCDWQDRPLLDDLVSLRTPMHGDEAVVSPSTTFCPVAETSVYLRHVVRSSVRRLYFLD